MRSGPKVTRLEITEFEYELRDMGTDYNGFNLVYEKGAVAKRKMAVLRIYTDQGIVGETITSPVELSTASIWAGYLIGKNALERDRLYSDVKRALRQFARIGVSAMKTAAGLTGNGASHRPRLRAQHLGRHLDCRPGLR